MVKPTLLSYRLFKQTSCKPIPSNGMNFGNIYGLLIVVFCFAFDLPVAAQTNRTFNTTGNWNTTTNWSGSNVADVIGERATINDNQHATIISPNNYTIARINVNNGAAVTINSGGRLNIGTSGTASNFFIADNGDLHVYGQLEIFGDLDLDNDVIVHIYSTGSVIVRDDFIAGDRLDLIVDAGGSLAVHGDFDVDNDTYLELTGDVSVGGNFNSGDRLDLMIGDSFSVTGNFNTDNDTEITVNSAGNFSVGGNVNSGDRIVLTANGDIDITGNFSTDNDSDIIVGNGGTVSIGGDVDAGDRIYIDVDGVMSIDGSFGSDNEANFVVDGVVNIGDDLDVGDNSHATGTGSINVSGSCSDGNSSFCGQGPLPVELLYITGKQLEEGVVLTWATASQINFDYFSVEHSTDGTTWEEIAQIKGEGTTYELMRYELATCKFVDGKNYYRLKSIDLDLSYEYSDVVAIQAVKEREFLVFPNPLNSGEQLSYELNFAPQDGDVAMIIDYTGTVVARVYVTDFRGKLQTLQLKAGLYMVRYQGVTYGTNLRLLVR